LRTFHNKFPDFEIIGPVPGGGALFSVLLLNARGSFFQLTFFHAANSFLAFVFILMKKKP
jgi:hypothetical protein